MFLEQLSRLYKANQFTDKLSAHLHWYQEMVRKVIIHVLYKTASTKDMNKERNFVYLVIVLEVLSPWCLAIGTKVL